MKSNTAIDIYRRNLQKSYVENLILCLDVDKKATARASRATMKVSETDIPSIARGQLNELKSQLKTASLISADRLSKFHILDLIARIDSAFRPK